MYINLEGKMPKKKTVNDELTLDDIAEDSKTIERFKQERLRRVDAKDVSFWSAIVFQSLDQKREFLEAISKMKIDSLYEGQYIDGQQLCKKLGIKVTPNQCKPDNNPFSKRLAGMVNTKDLKAGALKTKAKKILENRTSQKAAE